MLAVQVNVCSIKTLVWYNSTGQLMVQDRLMVMINIPLVLQTQVKTQTLIRQFSQNRLKRTHRFRREFFRYQSINRFLSILSFVLLYHEPHSLYIIYCLIVITYIQVCYAKVYRYVATLHQLSPCCSMYRISVYSILCMSNQFRLSHYIIVIPNYTIMVF